MNAASQVPSVVLISTLVSATCCCAEALAPAAAAIPAPTVIVTKSRRVTSSLLIFVALQSGRVYLYAVKETLTGSKLTWKIRAFVSGRRQDGPFGPLTGEGICARRHSG